ncbi:SsgA family sporulation/cell division regulator (plasmid) [Streptomyces goshikiensis]|uniref:SsgA family sporulation/cell division regulator n=1 Tax=Streptomyces goshikiensis TaxID=1942 RepID=A0ABZ1RXV1_9ACTN|nr:MULTISPECIES: SsgA family sporulation/cell division regulator [Streptomyces]MBP0932116.1 SsgA family sporulation/cell division regulator [Streptomyces sp. KCTC 0041BP]PJN17665.1 SsgA family sporulation/cell division regulator [Streptomyces sp. CB02120-2]
MRSPPPEAVLQSCVSALIAVHLQPVAGGGVPLFGQFSYDSADPYAVRAQFLTRDTVLTTWCFDRQMLAEGLHRPVGEGDVTFRPQWADGGEFVRVELSDSEGGEGAVLLIAASALSAFLDETYAVVTPGDETFDADGFLAELLARRYP